MGWLLCGCERIRGDAMFLKRGKRDDGMRCEDLIRSYREQADRMQSQCGSHAGMKAAVVVGRQQGGSSWH